MTMGLIDLDAQEKLIQAEVKKFAVQRIEPIAQEIDKEGRFPDSIIKELANLGLLGIIVPEEYGGSGLDTTSLCIVLEELSRICASIGTVVWVNNCLVAYPIIKYGSDEHKQEFLGKLGQGMLGGYFLESGIDNHDKKLKVKVGDAELLVSGSRDYVLNGTTAGFFLLPLRITSKRVLYIINRHDLPFAFEQPEVLGIKAAGIGRIKISEARLARANCLVSEDRAETALQEIWDYTNLGLAAVTLGIAEAAFETSVRYAKQRRQFGRTISEFPMVQEMLAEMKLRIESARLLVYDAAGRVDGRTAYTAASQMARLYSGETAVYTGIKAIQIHGGYGYIKEYPVERYLRDAKVLQLIERPPSDLRMKIAKDLLL